MRIGSGFDVHRLVLHRPLILGGVEIPYEKGLDGHSDADVLLHSLMDGLLGAMAKGDIGHYFPPDDEAYRDADSKELLKEVARMMAKEGYYLVNADLTIMAQRPKMAPYLNAMKAKIAAALGSGQDQIGIKATTTEKLGFVGREEGIAASAVVLIERK